MDGLVIGMDLCDTYTHISCMEPEQTWVIPTVVCKNKNADEWYVEEEAYAHTLVGDGIMEDKLLTQVMKDGTATIGGIKYEGIYLLKMFLESPGAAEKGGRQPGDSQYSDCCKLPGC